MGKKQANRKVYIEDVSEEADRLRNRQKANPEVFARNLQFLVRISGKTLKQASEEVGASYQWFRRIATKGLERNPSDQNPLLERMAKIFCLRSVEDVWDNDLIVFRVKGRKLEQQEASEAENEWIAENLGLVRKLAQLFLTYDYEYLRQLIEKLHSTLGK